MRAVLIVIPEQARSLRSAGSRSGAGRPLPLRQLDFALACGCEQILALGDPGSEEAVTLARAARDLGLEMRLASDSHGLLGLLKAADELLILAEELLPEAPAAVEVLRFGQCVLVLPAEIAVPEGFERIDRERAWAGAAVLRGELVEQLAELPPDSDAPAALLRIAMQARIPERRLPPSVLADGDWLMIGGGRGAPPAARGWLRRQLGSAPIHDLSGRLAQAVIGRWQGRMLGRGRLPLVSTSAGALLLALGVVLAWLGHPAIGLALLAPAGVALAIGTRLKRLFAGPFGRARRRGWRRAPGAWLAMDLSLGACAALAIEGDWLGRFFPVAVLMIAIHARPLAERHPLMAKLGDRVALALLLAIAAAFGLAEPALMMLALAFLLSDRAAVRAPRAGE